MAAGAVPQRPQLLHDGISTYRACQGRRRQGQALEASFLVSIPDQVLQARSTFPLIPRPLAQSRHVRRVQFVLGLHQLVSELSLLEV